MLKGEFFNSISHLVGAAAAMAGLAILVVSASKQGDAWKIVSFSVYGTTLVLLYAFSTLYHSSSGKAKKVFRMLDHQAIYLLIAGTYTPFTLVTLRGVRGWSLFGVIWGLAVCGMALDLFKQGGRRTVQVIVYLLMGWLILTAIGPLLEALPGRGLFLLAAGGGFYTSGVAFYAMDKKVRCFHGIWHLFVLAGSLCHYFAVLFYI